MNQLVVVMILLAAILVPGAAVVRLLALGFGSNPWLRFPLVVAAGVTSAAIPSGISVALGTGMRGFVILFACWSAALVVGALVHGRMRARVQPDPRAPDRPEPTGAIPRIALAACSLLSLATAWLSMVRGTSFQSDSSIHAAIIEKLVHLPGARFDEIGVVADGQPISSAILPVWHHLLGLAALPFEHPGIVAMWSAGAAVALLIPWASAALGWAATRTHAGAVLTAALSTAIVVVPWDGVPSTVNYLAYPGTVTIYVLIPALLAVLVESLLPMDARARRRVLGSLALLTLAVALLHLTYLYLIAIASLGMALVHVVLRPRELRRLLAPAAIVGGVSAVALAASLPFLTGDEQFNRGSDGSGGAIVRSQWFDILDGAGSAVKAEYFLEITGLALAGLLLSLLVLPVVRDRNVAGAMLAIGPLLALGAAARLDVVADLIAGLGSFPPIPRSYKVIPWVLSIVVLLDAADRRWTLTRSIRIGIGLLVTGAVAALSFTIPGRLGGADIPRDGIDPALPGWTFDAVLVVLLLQLVVAAIIRRRRRSTEPAQHASNARTSVSIVGVAGAGVLVLATVVLITGGLSSLDDRPSRILRAEGLFGGKAANDATLVALSSLSPGTVVFTGEGVALRMVAAAPVYVTHVSKTSFSNTQRRDEYRAIVEAGTSDEARLKYLDDHDVDIVLLPLSEDIRVALRRLLDDNPEWKRLRNGGDFVGWQRR